MRQTRRIRRTALGVAAIVLSLLIAQGLLAPQAAAAEPSGEACLPFDVPANAKSAGNDWVCKTGFYRSGNQCVALEVPAHAKAMGSSWYCDTGYRRSGDACQAIELPAHAKVVGNSWVCQNGYQRTSGQP